MTFFGFPGLADEPVSPAGVTHFHFSVCADPESFFRGAVCLYFRHLKIPVLSAVYSVRAALL